MKEEIRNWNPKQKIRIKYQIDKTQHAYWETTSNILYTHISNTVNLYMKKKIKLSNRQLYYRLVGKDLIPNFIEIYKRVCKFLTDCRYGGYIDWDAIEDRGRVPKRKSQWNTVQDLIDSAVNSYRLPRWKDQEYYVELYCEKEAMDSVLRPITDKYHIYFGYNKGYCSASTIYDIAKRVKTQIEKGKKVKVLYLGDHDPSGLDMIRDVEQRIKEFLIIWLDDYFWKTECENKESDWYKTYEHGHDGWRNYFEQDYINEKFEVIHVALTTDQIKQYNPPPNPAKFTDPRANDYVSMHGKISWELDSIEPEILMQLTEDAILKYLDIDKYNKWLKKENKDIKKLVDFGETLKK